MVENLSNGVVVAIELQCSLVGCNEGQCILVKNIVIAVQRSAVLGSLFG